MARVILPTSLARQFGLPAEQELAAADVRQLLAALEAQRPGIAREVELSMAVAIDGEIYQDAWLEPLRPDSEVFIIPKIGGG